MHSDDELVEEVLLKHPVGNPTLKCQLELFFDERAIADEQGPAGGALATRQRAPGRLAAFQRRPLP